MTTELPVLSEDSLDQDFPRLVQMFSGGQDLNACIQCGTCSGSCTFSAKMKDTPRRIMEMVRTGMKDEVLNSDTFWYCTSCYFCTVRCPRGINLTEVMYALKHIALATRQNTETVFYDCFNSVLQSYGRLYENGVLLKLALKTDPMMLLAYGPLGVKMFLKGKLHILPSRVRALHEIRQLYAKVGEMEEKV